ncbi:hypothetical protein FRB94_007944 [Tulasnella sp. JGI-2019a]|nr:hypothetical protein FRB94_007944 [Tulasnella sp. JGI-2019a]
MARLVFKSAAIVAACAFFTGVTTGTPAPAWGQCGGQSWTGPTTCIDYWCCIVQSKQSFGRSPSMC